MNILRFAKNVYNQDYVTLYSADDEGRPIYEWENGYGDSKVKAVWDLTLRLMIRKCLKQLFKVRKIEKEIWK